MDDNDLSTRVVGFAEIIHVPPPDDGLRHDWTCPRAMPLMRKGDCNCKRHCCRCEGGGIEPGATWPCEMCRGTGVAFPRFQASPKEDS